MTEQTGTTLTEDRLRPIWFVLLGVNGLMLFNTLPPFLRGEADSYRNQHAGLVLGAVTGFLLAASYLVRPPVRWILLAGSFLAIGFNYYSGTSSEVCSPAT